MKRALALVALLLTLMSVNAFAQIIAAPQMMNFQGRLAKPDGTPVPDGTYSIRFSLWDSAGGGIEKWNQTINPVTVRSGTFTVLLNTNTAGLFNGDLWLQIQIGTDAPLTPRQKLVSVAYAMKANSVPDGSITSASIADGTITSTDLAAGTLNSLSWLLGGNAGTNPASHFIGTTDNQPLIFKSNNVRALRLEWVVGADINGINVLGGYPGNSITTGATIATIGGGGYSKIIGTSILLAYNRVTDTGGTVGGGANNRAGNNSGTPDDATFAAVFGGIHNVADGQYSFVGGGFSNDANGNVSTIAGGESNTASSYGATVGGGQNNTAVDTYSTVGGGFNNMASGGSSGTATVAGGRDNNASGRYAAIGGGSTNSAAGRYATVPGGAQNEATGNYSLAAGADAKANHAGSFVWADASGLDFASTNTNQFLIRATNGVGINTANPSGYTLNVSGDLRCIGFFNASDARWKRNVASLANPLETLLNLRGVSYEWKPTPGMEFPDGRQIGFIAQEVEKVLPELVSTDSNGYKSVAYANIVPVLVEAVKQQQKQLETLKQQNEARQKQSDELKTVKTENRLLKQQLAELTELVQQVKAAQDTLLTSQTAHR